MPTLQSPNPQQIAMFGHIARALQNFLAKKDWSIGELNVAMGFDRGYSACYQWVNGKACPGDKYREKLSKLTGIPESELTKREPGKAIAIVPTAGLQATLGASRAKPASEVLSFSVATTGAARIRLDVTLPMQLATPLLRMLLDAGLVFSNGDSNGDESET